LRSAAFSGLPACTSVSSAAHTRSARLCKLQALTPLFRRTTKPLHPPSGQAPRSSVSKTKILYLE
jgi:hypothetical protein